MIRLDAARLQFDIQRRRYEAAMARLQVTLDQIRNGRSQREILHDSEYARLRARLDTLPVIEQAKGIMMVQRQCGPEDAFDLLRRASQSANVKVSVLAERIVKQAAARSRADGEPPPGRVGGRVRRPPMRSPR
jgi:hypothetical protein